MYVLLDGELWKFTKANWIKFCNCSAVKGSAEDPVVFGAKSVQLGVQEVLDWGTLEFSTELRRIKGH
jgi:hypothetical protein